MNTATPPLNFAQLNTPVEEAARDLGVPVARVRRMLCTLIVSQMLPRARLGHGASDQGCT